MSTDEHLAPLEPLQAAVLGQLGDIGSATVRRLVYETALIAYELGWRVAHARLATLSGDTTQDRETT